MSLVLTFVTILGVAVMTSCSRDGNQIRGLRIEEFYAVSNGNNLTSSGGDNNVVVVAYNSNVTIHCVVFSNATLDPQFSWYHDNVLIDDKQPKFRSSVNNISDQLYHATLEITAVQLDDSGIYQCNVSKNSRPGGVVIDSITINVHSEYPVLTPVSVDVVAGTSVTLTCFSADTDDDLSTADIKFYRGNEELDSDKISHRNATHVSITIEPKSSSAYYCAINGMRSNASFVNVTTATTTSPEHSNEQSTTRRGSTRTTTATTDTGSSIQDLETKTASSTHSLKNGKETEETTTTTTTTTVTTQDKSQPITNKDTTAKMATSDSPIKTKVTESVTSSPAERETSTRPSNTNKPVTNKNAVTSSTNKPVTKKDQVTSHTNTPITKKDQVTSHTNTPITKKDQVTSNTNSPTRKEDQSTKKMPEQNDDATKTTTTSKKTSSSKQSANDDNKKTTKHDSTTSSSSTKKRVCEAGAEANGITWTETLPNNTAKVSCPNNYDGEAFRYCSEDAVWTSADLTGCVHKQLSELLAKKVNEKSLHNVTTTLSKFVKNNKLLAGDIEPTVSVIKNITKTMNATSQPFNVTEHQVHTIMDTVDTVLGMNWKEWMELVKKNKTGAAAVITTLEDVTMMASTHLMKSLRNESKSGSSVVMRFEGNNSYIEYGAMKSGVFHFPQNPNSLWVGDLDTWSMLPPMSTDVISGEFVSFSGIIYRNISGFLTQSRDQSNTVSSTTWKVNSAVISLSVQPKPTRDLEQPLIISFKHSDNHFHSPTCTYLSFAPPFQVNGRWSAEGCVKRFSNDSRTECECYHLTNFAILMSPTLIPAGQETLELISLVGCAVSVACLVVTIVFHLCLWRYVKSDPAVILLNLCCALIVSYCLFVFGVKRTDNEVVCKVVAVSLHYIYLVVFALMLVEGIDVFLSVTTVFKVTSRLARLLTLGWAGPLLIVGVSMAVTQLEGYGNSEFCWLSLEGGLIWAFVGPVLAVILVNCIIIVVVLKAMFKEKSVEKKTSFEKARTGIRAICVLLPVMGLAWVFGVFSLSEDLVVFQYLFAIFNSLQGFFIFIFHCFASKQIRTAVNTRIKRYKSHRLNSAGSKYFSNTASQKYRNKVTSQRSNASQKMKLTEHPSDESRKQVSGTKRRLYEKRSSSDYYSSTGHRKTLSDGSVNTAFTHTPEDEVFYSDQSNAPVIDLGVLQETPQSSAARERTWKQGHFNNKVFNSDSNPREDDYHRNATPSEALPEYAELIRPMLAQCQQDELTDGLHQRRNVTALPRLVLANSVSNDSCRSQAASSSEQGTIGQDNRHSSTSPAHPLSHECKVRRRPSGGNVRFQDEKMARDLEQKLKAKRKRLDQIYGVVDNFWSRQNNQNNLQDENERHLAYLSTLQRRKARENWKKLRTMLLGEQRSDQYDVDGDDNYDMEGNWDIVTVPSDDASMHGNNCIQPFGGIRITSPGPLSILNWDTHSSDGVLIHWD